MKEIHRMVGDAEEQLRYTKEKKGIYELKRGIRKIRMTQEEREQERETVDHNILCYCIPICII